ncbi:MAG: helix-turn-helix transcriptional regulator [Clostridiales bacterium]|nr:helix-turn-helix transcriptional regulator [Clostridiales bacterium]
MIFSENLKNLRRENGIGQRELAKAVFTTVKTVSHWETGYTEPSIKQLIMLADFFEISLDELAGRKQ